MMNVSGYGQALYYPYLEFRDINWFKTAALYYEGLTRIVPHEYEPKDNEIVRRMNNECNFVRDYDPRNEANDVVDEFMFLMSKDFSDKTTRTRIMEDINRNFQPSQKMLLHKDKLSGLIIEELLERGDILPTFEETDKWINVDAPIAALYMTCLASKIAERNHLHIITDTATYQPLIQGLQQDPRGIPTNMGLGVAAYVIKTVVPKSIESVSVDQIIAFRDDYKKERVRFYEALEDLVKDDPNISDPEYLEDYIKQKATIVDDKVDSLKYSLDEVKIETANKLLAIATPPMALQMASILPQAAPIIVTAGLFLAGYGLIKQGRQKYMIKKENYWSYVLTLERGIKPKGLLHKMLNL